MSKAFVKQAVHPNNKETQELSASECNHNDMFMVKAYHCSTRWVSTEVAARALDSKPCLVIHGHDDQIIPLHAGQELANLLQSPLVVIDEASHLVMMEQPRRVALKVLEFIKGLLDKNQL